MIAFLALAVIGLTSPDERTVRGAYLVMAPAAWFVLVPLAHASLLSGVALSLGTTWTASALLGRAEAADYGLCDRYFADLHGQLHESVQLEFTPPRRVKSLSLADMNTLKGSPGRQ